MVFLGASAIRDCAALYGFGSSLAIAMDFPAQESPCTASVSGGISDSMSSSSKSAASHTDLHGTNLYRVAIVGAATLRGKEVAEMLKDRNFPAVDVRLLDDDESLGRLEALGDEISFIQSIRAEQFERVDFTFFAADAQSTRGSWKMARDVGNTIVDLSFALEDEAGASVRSPWIERESGQPVPPDLQPGPVVTAHPAATVLALLALRSSTAGKVHRFVATVFEPASEHGQKGMDELHEQTVNLLSFQELPKNVFDAQVAFNMLARYGPRSQPSLDSVSQRILKHYKLIAPGAAEPALLVVQAPIFHGHAFSVYLEMEKPVALGDIGQVLVGDHIVVARGAEDAPNNVSAAGQGDVLISLARDANHENGVWLWASSDNLRISALTAVECAESMTASRPRGQVQ
jgi:aspartate-semialdehyde dehydrogenase